MANDKWLQQYAGLSIGDHWKTSVHFIPCRPPSYAGATDGYNGLSQSTKVRKFIGNLCSMVDMADIPLVPISENTYMAGGKSPTKRSLGIKLDGFQINIGANDLATLRALIGEPHSAATRNVTRIKSPTYKTGGHLLLKAYNPETNLPAVDLLIMDVQVTIESLTGITKEAGERVYPVTLSSENAEIYLADHASGEAIFVEGWYDNVTTDINTNWSGSETTVVLGTGNASYSSSTTPVALPIDTADTSLTGYRTHLIRASIDGVNVAETAMTFATSTMTFNPAYAAANTALLVIYLASNATYRLPNYSGADQPSEIRDMWYGWPLYMKP